MEERDPAAKRRDPATVQAEIERTQQRLAWSIDEVVDRTNPKNIARRGWHRVRETGDQLVEEARAMVTGSNTVRVDSKVIEAPEGSVRLRGDEEVVSTYSTRGSLPPEVALIGVGVGLVLTVGLVVAWRRRAGRR